MMAKDAMEGEEGARGQKEAKSAEDEIGTRAERRNEHGYG